MLRAFALYFQLANIAEQHHRLRRRRAYEHEGRIPHESLAEARTRLHDGGATSAEIDAALARLSVELVVTAHPTEATRLGVPRAHRRIVRLLCELDDPDLPPSSEAHVHDTFAEESRSSGRATRYGHSGRASPTRSARGCGFSSRACGRPRRACSRS